MGTLYSVTLESGKFVVSIFLSDSSEGRNGKNQEQEEWAAGDGGQVKIRPGTHAHLMCVRKEGSEGGEVKEVEEMK